MDNAVMLHFFMMDIVLMWARYVTSRPLRAHNKYTSTGYSITVFIDRCECSLRHTNKNCPCVSKHGTL